jgi:integrase
MASIRKRGDKYQGIVYVGLRADGTRENIYVTADTKHECKALVREIENDLEKGRISRFRNYKVSDFFEDYLKRHKSEIADTTYINYKMYVDKHFKPFFKNKKFCKVSELDIKEYIGNKLEYLSSTTVRKHVLFMRRVFAEAKYKHLFDDITIPKNAKYVPVIPTDEQFNIIVKDCKMKKKELIVLIAGKCGLRLGEIFALDWGDIDFKKKEIRVDQAFARTEAKEYGLKPPKSENGYRSVPCPDEILEKLTDYRNNPYKSRQGFLKKNVVGMRIFDGRPDNFSNNFAKSMDKLAEETGNPEFSKIRFHDLRHYCASWLYKNGIPDHVAAEMLGHDIAVLKGIYQHLGLDDKAKIKDKIRDLQNAR